VEAHSPLGHGRGRLLDDPLIRQIATARGKTSAPIVLRWQLLGNFGGLIRDQLGFYARCARDYGDVVPVRFGPRPGFLIYHPDAIEEVLVVRNRDFVKTPGIRQLRALLGEGLLLSESDFWLRQRRLMQPAFHRQRVAEYGELMAAYAERLAAAWRDGAVLDVHDEMMTVTRAIVAKTLFDAVR
jgi:cytochrome P450